VHAIEPQCIENGSRAGAVIEEARASPHHPLARFARSVSDGEAGREVVAVAKVVLPVVAQAARDREVWPQLPLILKKSAYVFFNEDRSWIAPLKDGRKRPGIGQDEVDRLRIGVQPE
jgi:hypothetical protein